MQTVLFTFLHARVAREVAGLFEGGTKRGFRNEQRAGDTVTDRAGLAGVAAAVDADERVVLRKRAGEHEGRADDHLEGFHSKVIVEIALVDGDFAAAGE
ncbi:hypothetical protein SDC9_65686 [bioreactor metagenome]|uniref:Uncharacterized protein n=1 Tax=bioreactor metagenome TaxID=1076179 RepID=A0A644XSY4_9ZZZZ